MNFRLAASLVCLALASCHTYGFNKRADAAPLAEHQHESGVSWIDARVGTGAEVGPNSRVTVEYVGRLEDGTVFDSSRDRGVPAECELGRDQLIKGWELGMQGMRAGGKRTITVPPELGYGAEGRAGTIPPDATLVIEVELLSVEEP
jgi:FKBP-type peptidyl-prolyl cis-trans isomerase